MVKRSPNEVYCTTAIMNILFLVGNRSILHVHVDIYIDNWDREYLLVLHMSETRLCHPEGCDLSIRDVA